MTVAVMGCVVNGPGESKHANIGISLPGTGERPAVPVYIDGEKRMTLTQDDSSSAISLRPMTSTPPQDSCAVPGRPDTISSVGGPN